MPSYLFTHVNAVQPTTSIKEVIVPTANQATTASYTTRTFTTTKPTLSVSNTVDVFIYNYSKIIPVVKSTLTGVQMRVIGWNTVLDTSGNPIGYVPMQLFEGSLTLDSSNNITVNGVADMRHATTIVKNSGDAKIYNQGSSATPAYIVVDNLGSEFITVDFISGTGTANSSTFMFGSI